jgi:signal transduction histidine kinase
VSAPPTGESRLRALFEAGVAVGSELSLDAVLQRLVEAAAELTGARYDASSDGIGLLGMRERLSLLDGKLEVESSAGAGTTLVAEVPAG